MWEMQTITNPVARKDYDCGASVWIDHASYDDAEYDEKDLQTIRKAKAENNKILKGTRYLKITGKWEGEFDTFRAREDLDAICHKYELYPE